MPQIEPRYLIALAVLVTWIALRVILSLRRRRKALLWQRAEEQQVIDAADAERERQTSSDPNPTRQGNEHG